MRQILANDERVTIYGSEKDIAEAVKALSKYEDMEPGQLTEEWKKRDPRLEDVEGFIEFLDTPKLSSLPQNKARLIMQEVIDRENLKATMMFDGNTVWSFDRIIRNLKRIVKTGKLYVDLRKIDRIHGYQAPILSKYFYQFLHLCCGSIAHYDIYGWISHYPTVQHLREFFIKNEYGKRVLDHISGWNTDAKRIVQEIEEILNVNNSAC